VAVDESLTLPVPESVVAFYLVPTVDPTVDPVALLHLADQQFAGVLGELVSAAVAAPNPPLAVRPRDTMPPLPMDLFAALGATEAQLARIEEATHFVTASAGSLPGWPSLHEWITRALAAVAARELGADVVDVLDQRVLTAATVWDSLPDPRGRVRLSDWVSVAYSPGPNGYWCTTTGLRRFGLPELQTVEVPPEAVEEWAPAMTGIAGRLLAAWRAALMVDEDAAFVQLPTTITVSASDVNDAYEPVAGPRGPRSRPGPDTPTLTVRLALDPSSDPDEHDTFISVTPLSSYSLPLETRDPS
jgi:hypothetical protein